MSRLIVIVLIFCWVRMAAQTAVFNISSSACLNENISIDNQSSNATHYLWDFCHDGLTHSLGAGVVYDITMADSPSSVPEVLQFVFDDGQWYGFFFGRSSNTLYRLNFGSDLTNTPTLSALGNIGNEFNTPTGLKFYKDGAQWYGMAINFSDSHLIRLHFGNSLGASPTDITADDLGGFGGTNPRGISIASSGGEVYILMSFWSSANLAMVPFYNGLGGAPDAPSMITDGLLVTPAGVALQQANGQWYAIVNNFSSGNIVQFSFGTDLLSTPSARVLANVSSPTDVAIAEDGGNYFAFSEGSGGLTRIDLGSDPADAATVVSLGNFSNTVTDPWGLSLVRDQAEWKAFTLSQAGKQISRIDFKDACSSGGLLENTSTNEEPSGVLFLMPGNFQIDLIAYATSGNYDITSHAITINNLSSPVIGFDTDNNCLGVVNNFTGKLISGPSINTWEWDLGSGPVPGQTTSFQYVAAGSYAVKLSAQASNGCSGKFQSTVKIYAPPSANFGMPTTPICTNGEQTFLNQTADVFDGNLSYEWFSDGVQVGTNRDLIITFAQAGVKSIKLKVSIPGCSSESIQSTPSVQVGPAVGFSYSGACYGKTTTFTNSNDEAGIDSFLWQFGDGNQDGINWNAQHQFATEGDYPVTLTAISGGCSNHSTQTLTIKQHLVDFTNDAATENLPVAFTGVDLAPVADAIVVWNWTFNNTDHSSGTSASYSFPTSGNFDVSLSVSTAQGCEDSIVKNIAVAASTKPSLNVQFPADACRNANLVFQNQTVNAASYMWDFCDQDLQQVTGSGLLAFVPNANVPEGLKTVYDKGNYYTFLTSRDNNKIFRLKLGSTISTPDPSDIVDLNLTGLSGPTEIQLLQENDTWFAFVANNGSGKLTRYRFGDGLENPPDETMDLGTFNKLQGGLRGLDVVFDGQRWIAITVNFLDSKVHMIALGSSLASIPSSTALEFTSPLIVSPIGVSLVKDVHGWHAFITSNATNSLVHVDFGNDFMTIPSASAINSIYTLTNPFRVKMVNEGPNVRGYAISVTGELHFIDFGNAVSNSPTTFNKGNLNNALANTVAIDLVRTPPNYAGLVVNYVDKKITKISFSSVCNTVNQQSAASKNPDGLRFSAAGTYSVELDAYHANGTLVTDSKLITISNQVAPAVDFHTDNQCLGYPNTFSVTMNESSGLYSWNFGDGNVSSATDDPTNDHTYAAVGSYAPSLHVQSAVTGCTNVVSKPISIYHPPQANFQLPSGSTLCTNQDLVFQNSSLYDAGSSTMWRWQVNDADVSQDQDLTYAFTDNGIQSVRLIASLPGCSNESVQTLGPFTTGPKVDFTTEAKCVGDLVSFTNITSGDTNGMFHWDFGDGSTSAEPDAQHTFGAPGNFSVTLSSSSATGCDNFKTRIISIYPKPVTDFATQPPPLSCGGSATPFTNLTTIASGSAVANWQWVFGDFALGSSNISAPSYVYANAGTYTVSLTATTDQGCSATTQKSITIASSPVVSFTNTTSCVGLPVSFTSSGTGIQSYYWEMGTSYYTVANPAHTFAVPGSYPVKLTVTNGASCQTVVSHNVDVPVPLVPDFTVTRNCLGTDAQFSDITTGSDPVAQASWDFAGAGTATGQNPVFNFTSLGNKIIKLNVTAASGCKYNRAKTIAVVPAPKASFGVTPARGAAPLEVQFINASENAAVSSWNFQDGSDLSTTFSPAHVFETAGNYTVELTASNPQGCFATATQLVQVETAFPDIAFKVMTISENPDGSLKVILTLQNNGNTLIKDLPVAIDISGNAMLRETIQETIAPASQYNLVLSYGIQGDDLNFLCATADLQNDRAPDNNRICTELEQGSVVFKAYPNPVRGNLHLEWIARKDVPVQVTMLDAMGKKVLDTTVTSDEGLNQAQWDTGNLLDGIYLLILKSGSTQKTQRVVISGQN